MMTWAIYGSGAAGLALVAWALFVDSSDLTGGYDYVNFLCGAVLILIAALLWAVRWFLDTLPPWL